MNGYIPRNIQYEIPTTDFEVIKRLAVHDVAKISDSMARHGSMHNGIKSRALGMRLCGPAVTVLAPAGAYETVLEAAKRVNEGNVLVVAAQGFEAGFLANKTIYDILKERGANGILVDGVVTDNHAAVESGLGVFARGLCPGKVQGGACGEIQVPVYCGGMMICPGDYIVGDDDGTGVIPKEDIERVIGLADAHLAGELYRVSLTNQGKKLYELNNSIEKCRKWLGEEK